MPSEAFIRRVMEDSGFNYEEVEDAITEFADQERKDFIDRQLDSKEYKWNSHINKSPTGNAMKKCVLVGGSICSTLVHDS